MSDENLNARMEKHFEDAASLKRAVLIGELETVKEVSQWFVDRHGQRRYPPEWKASLEEMLNWANAASKAQTVDDAVLAVAKLSASCGSCHAAEGAVPKFDAIREPDPSEQMEQYQFAVDLMWEGLVGPSEPRWSTGVDAYAAVVTCSPPGAEGPTSEPFHAEACNSLLAAAGSARAAKSLDEKALAFAGVARGCASCHGAQPDEDQPKG